MRASKPAAALCCNALVSSAAAAPGWLLHLVGCVDFVVPPQCFCKPREIKVSVDGYNGVSSPHLTSRLSYLNAVIALACMCVASWTSQKDFVSLRRP